MNIEIPDFLIEMSKQMHEQNNRITADPIWQVRHKQYLVTEQGYNESHWEIAATEEGCTLYHSQKDSDYQTLILYLIDNHPDWMREWAEECADMEIELDDGEMMLEELELDRLTDAFNSSFDPDWHDLPEGVKKFHMQEIAQPAEKSSGNTVIRMIESTAACIRNKDQICHQHLHHQPKQQISHIHLKTFKNTSQHSQHFKNIEQERTKEPSKRQV